LPATEKQRFGRGSGGVTKKGFMPGTSGNPRGRSRASYDVAALAKQHTPEAIAALVRGLSDPRHYVAAAVALLDRAHGRPVQAIASQDNAHFTFMHLIAARASSDELIRSRAIEGGAVAPTTDRETIPFDLSVPALE
jgi:hypothetical protein